MNEDCVSGALCQAREQEQAPDVLCGQQKSKVLVPNLDLTLGDLKDMGLNSGLLI